MGTTRHCLSLEGKFPVDRLILNIWAKGLAICSPTNLIILVETPFISQLLFWLKFFDNFHYMFRGGIAQLHAGGGSAVHIQHSPLVFCLLEGQN
jgi:hypothetical protein